jgi:hypothetical protein
MKRFSEQFHTKSKSVNLSSTEKQELRERLVSYMEYHPLPAELKSAQKSSVASKSPVLHEAFKTVSLPFSSIFKSFAVAAALVLVVVPFMAEQSVPGDTLYAVKVQFNEEVRSTLTFDSYEKVEWETQLVNRRIAEARLLESEGRLTDEVEAEVAQAVRTHTQNAQKEIEIMRALDADEATLASIEFDSNLEAQAVSLQGSEEEEVDGSQSAMVEKNSGEKGNLIADAVDESRALNEQPNASTTPSYAKLIARVEQNTTRMYELSDTLESLNPNTKENVARRIQDIDRSVETAIASAQENEEAAQDILIDVLKRTQKLIVFMTDFEVSGTIDIEELVPVILTSEEEVEEIIAYKKEITQKQAEIENSLSSATTTADMNLDFIDKVESGLDQISALLISIKESSDFSEIKGYAIEAIELADDLQLVLEKNNLPSVSKPAVPNSESTQSTSTATTTTATSTTTTATSTASTTPEQLPENEVATTSSSTQAVSATTTAESQ